ncbi:MAG TPA: hypothetical protein PKA99_11480 [Dermatophilaceae bacterium]|jgi:hypothetical protein|nr:hypothetical protein [Dermatophilaceae bacterium]
MSEPFDDRGRGSAPDPEDIDARFREIIAGWDTTLEPPDRLTPEVTSDGTADSPPDAPSEGAGEARSDGPRSPLLPPHGIPAFISVPLPAGPERDGGGTSDPTDPIEAGWRSYEPPDADDHFEPPEPALPPAHDATFWLAIGGIIAGPLLILWATLVSGNPDPGWWVLTGIAATIVGFGLIVMRGSAERDPDDDGSRV